MEQDTWRRSLYTSRRPTARFRCRRYGPAGKQACLAVFDPLINLKVTRRACGPAVMRDPTGLVSPDGTWLAAWSYMSNSWEMVLVRLDDGFTNPVVSHTWPAGTPGRLS
jgi:hypothetical protein